MHLIFIFLLFTIYVNNSVQNGKEKLQIGIKKRIDNCPVKSKKGDFLHIHYKGTLEDNTEIGSTYEKQPITFTLGSGQVIKGWDQGLIGMCIKERRKLVVPPSLAYGNTGVPPRVPPNSLLTFEVELVHIERKNDHHIFS